MTKILTTHNAEITTATVEVKTLTISGKQVTLSVFRQLREVQLVCDDGTLAGLPWGYVNYHPDKCDKDFAHLHVVWQRGQEILRSHVFVIPVFDRDEDGRRRQDYRPYRSDAANAFYTACVRRELRGEDCDYFGGKPILREPGPYANSAWTPGWGRTANHAGVAVYFQMARAAVEAAEALSKLELLRADIEGGRGYRADPLSAAEQKLAASLVDLDDADSSISDLAGLFNAFDGEVHAEAERRRRHRETRQALLALPHLFIAV